MYQIVTDSCCDLPYSILEKEAIDFISMEVILNGEVFLDDGGKTFKNEAFYKELKKGAVPSTSQINVSRYVDFFIPYVKENIPILYLCFSSGLSGSYQSANLAAAEIKKEYPKAEIYVLDTLAASGGQGLMVLDAIHKQKEGFSFDENIKWLENQKINYQQWGTVDDLNHLYHGGRIKKSTAAVGDLLSVKPILLMDEKGKLVIHHKVRTRKRSLHYIANKVIQGLKTTKNPSERAVIITNAGDLEAAKLVKNLILDEITPKNIFIFDLGPTISSHTGYGCVTASLRGNKRYC